MRSRFRAYAALAAGSLRSRWWEPLLQSLSAALAVALIGAGGLTILSVQGSYQATSQRLHAPQLWVHVPVAQANSVYDRVSAAANVATLGPIYLQQTGVIRLAGKELPAALTLLPPSPPAMQHLTLLAGTWPGADRPGMLLDRSAASALSANAGVGTKVELTGPGGSLQVAVTGLVLDMSHAAYPLSSPAVVYVPAAVFGQLAGGASGQVALFGVRVHDAGQLLSTALAIQRFLPAGVSGINGARAVVVGLQPLTLAVVGFLLLFGLFAAAASLVFIAGTTRAEIIRSAKDIGILRAIGWKIGQVRRALMLQKVAIVFIGVIAGSVASLLLGAWLTTQIVQVMGLQSSLSGAPLILFPTALLVLLATAAATALATLRLGAVSPAATLAAGYRQPPSRLSATLGQDRGPLAARLGVALLSGRPGRTTTAAVVLVVGLVTVVFCVIMSATISNFSKSPSTWGLAYDWRVDFLPGVSATQVQTALAATTGVARSEPVFERSATLSAGGGGALAKFVEPGEELLVFHLLSGHPINGPTQVLAGAGLASSVGWAPGQSIGFDIGGHHVNATLAGVYRELDNQGQVIVANASVLHAIESDPVPSYFLVRLRPTADDAASRRAFEAALGGRTVVTGVKTALQIPFVDVFAAVFLVLGLGLIILATVVMFTMALILAEEQTLVVGILKAIGARRRQIGGAFLWASLLITVPCLIVAIPLGIALSTGLIAVLSASIGGVDAVVPLGNLAVLLPLGLIAPIAAFLIPAVRSLTASPAAIIRAER